MIKTALYLFSFASFGLILSRFIQRRKLMNPKRNSLKDSKSSASVIYPPFPSVLVKLLQSSSLCFLSTTTTDGNGSPHLSLMNFTYLKKNNDELIILTTRANTQKFQHITESQNVGLLLHDFPHLKDSKNFQAGEGTASITLKGVANIETGAEEEEYRNIHLTRNPEYKQFIVGRDIRVVTVRVESARICNFQDEVLHWDVSTANCE